MNRFAGERHEFFGQNSSLKNVNPMVPPLGIWPQNSRLSQAKWCIFFHSKSSEATTPIEIG